MNDMKNFCNKLKEKANNISGVISNGKFIFMSDTENLKELLEKLKTEFNIKGGGTTTMIQGSFVGNPQEIIEKIKGK